MLSAASAGGCVVKTAGSIDDRASWRHGAPSAQFTLDHRPGKYGHPPPGGQQARAHSLSEIEPHPLVAFRPQHFAERYQVLEIEDIGRMPAKGARLPASRTPEINPCQDAQQEIVRLQVARLLQHTIDIAAVDESFSRQSTDPAKKDP